MKKKNKKHDANLSMIIDEEIKHNSLRQGFPRSLGTYLKKIEGKKITNHKDLTNIPFVTIDGEDSKDFDDAVWSKHENNETKIMVAISDVSFFITKNDPLDLEAKKRGNSFYFPDRVIPMFPEEISNNICSLVPHKKRACLVIEIKIKDLKIKSFDIHRAKIISVARLSYNQVDEIYFNKLRTNEHFLLINNLFKSYEILKKISELRNKINFSTDEFQIIQELNNDFFFKKKKKLISYKLIEEFMVLANETVAKYLKINNLNSIFRNHERPKDEKIKELTKLLKENALYNNERFKNQKDFNKVLERLRKKKTFLNDALLRAQAKAYYGEINLGHFGLGLDYYTHFTSPIRRYSDLNVHRDLVDFFFNKKRNNIESSLSKHLTFQEKMSDSIERNIIEKACSLYIRNKKKKYFTGIIDGIESFGIFIKAIELPFSCLVRTKYRFINNFQKQEKIKDVYKIGQKVSFKIKKNNVKSGRILGEKMKIII